MDKSGATARLELRGIRKVYPSVVANDGIDLSVAPGEIHAVLGENGAGKSTLMKIIYGVTKPTEGVMIWEGKQVTVDNPAHARSLGIGMVFQHFSLFETLTVVENVALALPGSPDLGAPVETDRVRLGALRTAGRSAPAGPRLVGWRAPARRNHPLPAAEPAAVDHGRADFGAHAAGRAQVVRDPAPARLGGLQHSLYQPQARRDPGVVPHGDGAARRQGHRHLHSVAGDGEVDGAADDRPRSPGVRAWPARRAHRCAIAHRRAVARGGRSVRHRSEGHASDGFRRRDRRHRRRVGQRPAGIAVRALGRGADHRKISGADLRRRGGTDARGQAAPAGAGLRARGAAGTRRGAADVAGEQCVAHRLAPGDAQVHADRPGGGARVRGDGDRRSSTSSAAGPKRRPGRSPAAICRSSSSGARSCWARRSSSSRSPRGASTSAPRPSFARR